MQRIIATIKAGETGSPVANLQDALLALLDRQVIRALDPPNQPTLEELQKLARALREERAASLFGEATTQMLMHFQVQQSLGDNLRGVVEERTAAKLNEHLEAIGAFGDPEPPKFVVRGRITDASAGQFVQAYDKDFRGEEPLGRSPIDGEGKYEIRYTVDRFASADGKGTADVRVAVCEAGGRELISSGIVFNAPAEITIDLALDTGTATLSEYERHLSELVPILQDVSLLEVDTGAAEQKEKDLDFLAGDTGIDRQHIAWLVKAAGFESKSQGRGRDPVPAAVFFTFMRVGGERDLDAMLSDGPETWRRMLRQGVKERVLPDSSSRNHDGWIEALTLMAAERALRRAPDAALAGRASLGDLLATMPADREISASQRLAVARLQVESPKRDARFWKGIEEIDLTPRQVRQLRVTLELDGLTDGSIKLVRALQDLTPADTDGTLTHLVALPQNRWLEVAAHAVTSDDDLGMIELVADRLAKDIEQRHPSASFLTRLESGALRIANFPTEKVARVLREQPGLDLKATDIEPFLLERNLDGDEETKRALLKTQRLLRLGATQEEAATLMSAGIENALAMVPVGKGGLVAAMGGAIPEHRIAFLHEAAQGLFKATLAAASMVTPFFDRIGIAALAKRDVQSNAVRRFPSIQTLFGDQSFCACNDCNSVLGPPAYLVDLLRLLERNGVEGALRTRRPDIAELELTCENTNTELPYVDLVLEILENAAVFPTSPIVLTSAEMAQLDAGTVPAPLRTELQKSVAGLDGEITVGLRAAQSSTVGAPQRFVLRNAARGWTVQRWQTRLTASWPAAGVSIVRDVAAADRDTWLQALRALQVPVGLLSLVAPEKQAPITGVPTIAALPSPTSPEDVGSESWRVTLVRSLAIDFIPGAPMGVLRLWSLDGTLIEGHQLQPGTLVQLIAGYLNKGLIHAYLANLLPRLQYTVQFDAVTSRFILTANVVVTVRFDPARLLISGLAYSASRASGDLTVFSENRNPEAYRRLNDAVYPRGLPFDAFREEVRACLAIIGVPRVRLLRSLRPTTQYRSLDDASEILQAAPSQLRLVIEGNSSAARVAELWGLEEMGNVLVDPIGREGAAPVPSDWLGALGRLSVLLDRAGVDMSTLLAILGTRYLQAVSPHPHLDPPFECKPSLVTLKDLGKDHLDRLQRFLRLLRITKWTVRDIDAVIDVVTDGGVSALSTEAQMIAFANVGELAARLGVSVRRVTVWLGPIAMVAREDEDVGGAPGPSLYDEIFRTPQLERQRDPDLSLDGSRMELAYLTAQPGGGVVYKRLTQKMVLLAAALQASTPELGALIGQGRSAVVPDQLSFGNLVTLLRHVSLAQALGLSLAESRALELAFGVQLFPVPATARSADVRARQLLDFIDAVELVRASGFSLDELSWLVSGAGTDESAGIERRLQQLEWLREVQSSVAALPTGSSTEGSEATLRVTLAGAGWPTSLVDRVFAGTPGQLGLSSTPVLGVEVLAAPTPGIPSGLPFSITPVGTGAYSLQLTEAFSDATAESGAFDALGQVSGLGPLASAASPASRLRHQWTDLQGSTRDLVRWLQSVELPQVSQALRFELDAPQGLPPGTTLPPDLSGAIRMTPAGRLEVDGFLSAVDARRLTAWAAGASNADSFREALDRVVGPPSAIGAQGSLVAYDGGSRSLVLKGYPSAAEVAFLESLVPVPAFATAVQAVVAGSRSYVERRAGQRLLLESQVLDLFVQARSSGERVARVQAALTKPLRRQLIRRLACARAGVDTRLFEALDTYAQLAAVPRDVLAPLSAEGFLATSVTGTSAGPALEEPLAATDAIDRLGLLCRRLDIRPSEAAWFDPGTGFLGLADLGLARVAGASPSSRFAAWRQSVTLFQLRARIPGQSAALEELRTTTGGTLGDALRVIERLFDLAAGSIAPLLALDGALTRATELRNPVLLGVAIEAAILLRRLQAPAAALALLAAEALDDDAARAARGLILGRVAGASAPKAMRAAMDLLRERQRAALVEYLVHRDGARDASELHARYLIDVQMGPAMRTSRVKQAISSTQLFMQRWLMNVEDGDLPRPSSEVATQWQWLKSYRVWEANRKVFLFPENWLEPGLRDDKSHLFRKLESEVLQSDLSTERAIRLFQDYLMGLNDLSRLSVRAMFRESTAAGTAVVHVLARSPDQPPKFFYRQWAIEDASKGWTPWEPVDPVTNTEHVVCFVLAGRPHVAWVQIGRAGDEGGVSVTVSNWELEFLWSHRTNEGWAAPRKWRTKFKHPMLLNKDERVSFALRVHDHNGVPHVRLYGGREKGGAPILLDPITEGLSEPIPSPRPAGARFTNQRLVVQVVGTLDSQGQTHYIALDDARVEVWGDWFIKYRVTDNATSGTSSPAWPAAAAPTVVPIRSGVATVTLTVPMPVYTISPLLFYEILEATAKVFVRVTVAGQVVTIGPVPLDPRKNHEIRYGVRFPLSQDDPRFTAGRAIRLVHIASFDWNRSLGVDGGPPGDGTELIPELAGSIHESSGFREKETFAPLTWRGKQLTHGTAGLVRFFAVASACTNRTALDEPIYVEELGRSGFFTSRSNGVWDLLPAADFVCSDALHAIGGAQGDRIDLGSQEGVAERVALLMTLVPSSDVSRSLVGGDAQFTQPSPYYTYDWEIFFHIPLLFGYAFATQQRFAEALRWLHLVFDPTRRSDYTGPQGASPGYWRFQPFAEMESGRGIDDLLTDFSREGLDTVQVDALRAQIDFSRNHPFRPHGIARMRPRAYQWMTVLKYIDVVIAWGDQLFKRDTIESINEATQLYLLAADLLGPRPMAMPARPRAGGPPTYAALEGKWDDLSNAWVALGDLPFFRALLALLEYLRQHGVVGPTEADTQAQELARLASLGSLVFCVPPNDSILSYWDTIGDRLFKIRNGQNIDGLGRRLALFEPPIDPALLVRAVAAGLDIGSVLKEMSGPASCYRFSVALSKAVELCNDVKGFGAMLLSAWEKRDAEELSNLRSTQEIAVLELVGDIKRRQRDATNADLAALRRARSSIEVRYRHYQRLLGKDQIIVPPEQGRAAPEVPRLRLAQSSDSVDSDLRGYGLTVEEADHLGWLATGNTYASIGGGFQVASGIAHMLPNYSTTWFGQEVTFGGTNVGLGLGAVGQFFSLLAANASFQASRSSIIGGHQRRYDEWILQSNLAAREMVQVDGQILAAQIRSEVAAREVASHEKHLANMRGVDEFMRDKFSNQELYQWMVDRLAEVYGASYQLAYEFAKRAERALELELGTSTQGTVRFGAWSDLREGLLAGERLSLDLKRLDAMYMERNIRELEPTKHVSLAELDPLALFSLQTTGVCEFDIPEIAFDLEFAGHYFRRIKTVSISVPCVVGPYKGVSGTLTLLENRVRTTARGESYAYSGLNDPRFAHERVAVQSIAVSSGRNDSGLFELSLRDERYLPFEGAGAVSRWRFELPSDFRSFDYSTITDLVLHMSYTAREGGPELKVKATQHCRSVLETASMSGGLVRMFSLRSQFSTEWARLVAAPGQGHDLVIDKSQFAYVLKDRNISVWKVSVFVRHGKAVLQGTSWVDVHRPHRSVAGQPEPGPLPLGLVADTDGIASYEVDLTTAVGATRIPVEDADAALPWKVTLTQQGAAYGDVILALWCTARAS